MKLRFNIITLVILCIIISIYIHILRPEKEKISKNSAKHIANF